MKTSKMESQPLINITGQAALLSCCYMSVERMETSVYQNLKLIILDVLNLSKDAIHMHLGLLVFFLAVVLWRRGRFDVLALLPVFMVASAMEILDLHDDLVSLGYMRWSASLHDLINTLFWPTIIVILSKWLGRRENS